MPSSKIWSAEKSAKLLRSDASALQKATNSSWGIAKKTPLFLRKPKYVGSGKSKKRATMINMHGKQVPVPQRANRCFRSSALKVLLSGAAAEVDALLKSEGESLKTKVNGEAHVAASLPKLSVGAELALEHALVAYTQTVFDAAKRMKDSMKLHGKVSAGCMSAAADIVNKAVFSSSTLAPGQFVYSSAKRAKRTGAKKTGKEDKSGASGASGASGNATA